MSTSERYKLVDIAPEDSEYIKIKQLAESTANGKLHLVLKIERIQNVSVYKQYMTRKSLMDGLQPNIENERRLWHGTDSVAMDNMIRGGFNRSYCGKNAAKFGKGVYFAVEFQYAAQSTYSPPDTSGYKHVFLSRVLVGEFTQGDEFLLEPPLKPDDMVRYDSVVDSPNLPKIFVIFHDAQALPEYLVTFS
jgi:poly [ADP-ribose] polymerase 10/14/15